ncbi:MAG TPA: cupin-like domain-containing protein [Novosphingobium sp.]|nr:cupin-like domain-containing protein [Novosphingobium sp.]
MAETLFPQSSIEALARVYPNAPVKLAHRLLDHTLLTIAGLAELAARLPAASVEYNSGRLPIGIAPEDVPQAAMSAEETIRQIDSTDSWAVLKRIEQVPAYAALLREVLAELEAVALPRTGAMHQCEGFIFISSPHAVTPFHFDPEHNVLLQIRGSKTMTVFRPDDEALCDPQVHEQFHHGNHHRNLPWDERFAAAGQPIAIGPGEAVHVPVKAPHFVRNGDAVSVSLSVTWRSEWSVAEADARGFNRVLRQAGLHPRSPGQFPHGNRPKALAYRALRRLKMA